MVKFLLSFFPSLIKPKYLLVLLVVVLAVFGTLSFISYQNTKSELKKIKSDPTLVARQEAEELVAKIGKFVELPKENPTVATVTDAKKLSDQPFFQKAQNGDKVLIYTKAKKAIIYRPSANKVIDVAAISFGEGSQIQSKVEKKVTVALYNGTATIGLTKIVEPKLTAKFSNIDVTIKENAERNDYDKTIVVDISGKNADLAKKIAEELDGEVGSLPEGESKPSADILVILGK